MFGVRAISRTNIPKGINTNLRLHNDCQRKSMIERIDRDHNRHNKCVVNLREGTIYCRYNETNDYCGQCPYINDPHKIHKNTSSKSTGIKYF